jgi:hypothetical protein
MNSNTFIGLTVGLVVFIIIFLALREVMLWYWKVNEIESIKHQVKLQTENQRKQIRIDYYKAKILGDKQAAYESLLQIVIDDLLKDGLKNEQRQHRYSEIEKKHKENFGKLGYMFSEYAPLFD